MNQIDVNEWQGFEDKVAELRRQFPKYRSLIFRGVGDLTWPLTTTLERHEDVEMPFADYYRMICVVQPQIQSFTETMWDEIAPWPEIEKTAREYDKFDLHLWGGQFKALGYMAYLRHHGFPSPLMDWTRSPYIAAFFAFRNPMKPPSGRVAVFVYCERPNRTKGFSSNRPRIFRLGPNVRTHQRHHLQQGEYTICLRWELDKPWRFVGHETVFGLNDDTQDALWKFTIPWSERLKVLKSLDEHNVNAFSLFQSDEALLETIALRQLALNR